MANSKIQLEVVDREPAEVMEIDLEEWLADLLVDYWLSQQEGGGD